MIRAKHAKEEIIEAQKIMETEGNTDVKLRAIVKLITVVIKIALSSRYNVVKIMDKLGIEKEQPTTREESNE